MFGLFSWSAVPQLPAELILMPPSAPINIYTLSSWARSTIIPLLIVMHHQPLYALPNGTRTDNDYLNELWCEPMNRMVPYIESYFELWNTDGIAFTFAVVDKILVYLKGLRYFKLRGYSRQKCLDWILTHQEESGDWSGIFLPMAHGIMALTLEGFSLTDFPVRRGLEAIERFTWHDHNGKRVQACVSPVWDTVLMVAGLCDASVSGNDERLIRAMEWVKSRQLCVPEGDWRVYRPRIIPGGWSFQYYNNWYPDLDDTAAALLAFLKQDPDSGTTPWVIRATEWVLGMQNSDGGFAAFDYDNNKVFLNKIPFSDMNALSDPSTADVTGRVLEAFGLLMRNTRNMEADLKRRVQCASKRAIVYLVSEQEPSGAWYGRWGSNYIYGTSNVLCALAYFSKNDLSVQNLVTPAIRWLKSVQTADGGWGEELITYLKPECAGCGITTPSQTAWGLMGLLAHLPPTDIAIGNGISDLISTQTILNGEGASRPETRFTATGFPEHFYMGYSMYAQYFPLMALGRFVRSYALLDQSAFSKKEHEAVSPAREEDISTTSQEDLLVY